MPSDPIPVGALPNVLHPFTNDATGVPSPQSDSLSREVVLLRARCSNLRHWCRILLDDARSTGVLDEPTVADLRAKAPEIGEAESHELISQLAHGGSVPAKHPLAPATTDVTQLRETVATLTVEHERLRKVFFALHDYLHPTDDMTEEYFLTQQRAGSMRPMEEVLAEIGREFGERT
jgi:hypothetical protein